MSEQQEKKPKEKKIRAPKSTNVEVDRRVKEVQDWILLGYTRWEIIQNAAKWNAGDRTIDEYISRAREMVLEINRVSIEVTSGQIVKNYWKLYRAAIGTRNLTLASSILEKIAKVRGLDKLTLVVEGERPLKDLSDEELEKILGAS